MHALEIVKSYYAAFNAKNWNGMLNLVSDEIIHEPNEGETRTGIELFRAFLQKMDTAYNETLTDLCFFQGEDSNRIAVEFTVNGIYQETDPGLPEAHGQNYVLPAGAFLNVENGKITRITTYYNLELWIKLVS